MHLKTVAICFVLCLAAAEAFNFQNLKNGVQNYLKSKEAKKLEKLVVSRVGSAINQAGGEVEVEGDNCAASGCCALVDLPKVGIHSKACLNMTYHRREKTFDVRLTMDGNTIINEHNTKEVDMCRKMQQYPAKACVAVTDMKEDGVLLTGKAELQMQILGVKVYHRALGAVKIPMDEDVSQMLHPLN